MRESPVSAQDIAKIKEKIPLARTAPSASDVGAIRKTADDIVRQIKQDLKNDFGDLGLGEPPKSTYFEPKTPTPSEQKMPTLGRQQFVHGERISSIQETIAKSMDDIDTVRARITSDIHARIHKARRKLDRYGLEGEFDIVRYPSSVRPPHPPAPSIRVSTLTDMRTELWNLSNIGINVRNLSVPQRGRDEAGRRMTEREKPRREVQPKEEPVIP
ncbi:MAG: hypothetical protein NZ888_08265, partial [Candidatus Nitrosocaldus sp.]|nr:hypothetical protein [Candidatus Nitrosocaldus sp.]MDW8001032.1 hypothetical protein [Candidatus Nitrosocaldus sp.]